jgi:CHAD domain-containing protein
MVSERYLSMIDVLDSWQVGPPWSGGQDLGADERLPAIVEHEWRRVERAVARAGGASDTERSESLHEARKAAKRARYAAEVVEPVLGEGAHTADEAKTIQTLLGAHHDTVVAIDRVLGFADEARDDGGDTFTFGVLTGRLEAELAEQEAAFWETWKEMR